MKKRIICFIFVLLLAVSFVACSSDENRPINDDYSNNENDNDNDTAGDFTEDPLSGIWSVVEGGDDHSIIIANGNIQIIDDSYSEICKYTKPSDNVFVIDLDGTTFEFKYENGLLYRYEYGEADGYVYERTAYNSNK